MAEGTNLPVNPPTNMRAGSLSFPGKRTATGPPTYSDIALSAPHLTGTGRNGTIMPGGTVSYTPTSGVSNDAIMRAFGTPNLGSAITTTVSGWTNGQTTYSRLARRFSDNDLDVDLMERGMLINTMRDMRTTTPLNNRKREWVNRHTGVEGFLRRRPLGNHHIMMDPVRTNYLLACQEPATTDETQHNAWAVNDVLDKWHFRDGIVLNQEGGKSVLGRVNDPGKARLLNMVVHGRIEGVLNIWGSYLQTDSELFLVLKRAPRPKYYVLDPSGNQSHARDSYSPGITRHPVAAAGIKRLAIGKNKVSPTAGDFLVKNPWQLVPFMPKGTRDFPTFEDTYGEDDHGNVVPGHIIRIGRVWFPGRTPTTSPQVEHLQPLNNMGEYIRCGVITVLMDNHGYGIRK